MIHWLLVGMDNTDIVEADDFDDLQRLVDSELYHTVVKLNDESIRKIKETLAVGTVRHGHWIKEFENEDGRNLRCSECRMVFFVGKGRDGNYCPECGARMDEK